MWHRIEKRRSERRLDRDFAIFVVVIDTLGFKGERTEGFLVIPFVFFFSHSFFWKEKRRGVNPARSSREMLGPEC